MWLILQQDTPEDFVIATGKTTYIRDFVRMAFAEVGIELEFTGEGVDEKGIVEKCDNPNWKVAIGQEIIKINPYYFRPTEVDLLIGDATKANQTLGWKPKYTNKRLRSGKQIAGSDRRKKILNQTKGYWGARKNAWTIAKNTWEKGLTYAYRDRKNKKRSMRALWIQRINAGVRQHGLSYSEFMGKLHAKNIVLNRKALADLAMNHPEAFTAVVNSVK